MQELRVQLYKGKCCIIILYNKMAVCVIHTALTAEFIKFTSYWHLTKNALTNLYATVIPH
jgi:hypothetical protein